MRTRSILLLALSTSCASQSAATAPASGLDAALSSYDYPHPVARMAFEAQGYALEMAYLDVAPAAPNGATVLLLHGKNFSAAYWDRTIEALTAKGYRVVAPDQVGFGKSSKPIPFQYSFFALATFTRDLITKLGVEEVHVVGHSMGGMVATRYALMFPDHVASLVLVNPIGLEDWKRWVPYRTIDEWYEVELAKTPEGIRSYMTKSYFDGTWKPAYDPLLEIQAGWVVGPDRERIAKTSAYTYDMIFTQPVVHEFGDLRVPTTLIIGQRDRTALMKDRAPEGVTLGDYPALGRRARDAIADAELVELDGIGHIPFFESFDAYWDALSEHLVRVTR